MLSKEDLARESAVVISANDEQPRLLDVPRDTSAPDQPFFKLPLPDEGGVEEDGDYDDVVIVAVGDDDEEQVNTRIQDASYILRLLINVQALINVQGGNSLKNSSNTLQINLSGNIRGSVIQINVKKVLNFCIS